MVISLKRVKLNVSHSVTSAKSFCHALLMVRRELALILFHSYVVLLQVVE